MKVLKDPIRREQTKKSILFSHKRPITKHLAIALADFPRIQLNLIEGFHSIYY